MKEEKCEEEKSKKGRASEGMKEETKENNQLRKEQGRGYGD